MSETDEKVESPLRVNNTLDLEDVLVEVFISSSFDFLASVTQKHLMKTIM